jgi:hypothetical protein
MEKNSTPAELAQFVYGELERSKIKDKKPTLKVLTELFETLYFTSLQTEEGQFIKLIVTLLDHQKIRPEEEDDQFDDWKFYAFESEEILSIKNLVKLSKAVDPWSSSLSVYYDENEDLYIYGMIDQTVHYQSFLNYEREERPDHPGIIKVMITGIGILSVMLDYQPLATLNQNSLVKHNPNVFEFGPISEFLKRNCLYGEKVLRSVVGYDLEPKEVEELNSLVYLNVIEAICRILLRIKNYGHGGAIMITKEFTEDVKIKYKLKYNRINRSIKHIVSSISDSEVLDEHIKEFKKKGKEIPIALHNDCNNSELYLEDSYNELFGAIRFVSSLSCVDGLVLLSPLLTVNGFGTVITEKKLPEFVHISKGSSPSRITKIKPEHYGTRHQSMFSYCHKHPDSIGFLVSQDGEIRAVKSVEGKLVMWENIKVYQFQKSSKLPRKPVIIRPA